MTTLTVTKATGGTAQPASALYITPEQQMLGASAGTALSETGLNAPVVAELLSACLAHERCGVHLYRSVAGRTTEPELRERCEAFGIETEEHVQILEDLVRATGGDPHFVSPSARATEMAGAGLVESTYLLGGSIDPMTKQLVFHEYNEVYLYWSVLQNESDKRIKGIWEEHLDMEIGQLHAACDLLRRYEGVDPEEILPPALPDTPVTFEPNKGYVRDILANQVDLRADGVDYVWDSDLPADHRSRRYREVVNAGGVPSEVVIDQNRGAQGREYRDETDGENPVPALRERTSSTS